MEERMLRWFKFEHLPENLQAASAPFSNLAAHIVANIPAGPERTVALRKLLEAKDAAVRASLPEEQTDVDRNWDNPSHAHGQALLEGKVGSPGQ